jgi:hypothetical protein
MIMVKQLVKYIEKLDSTERSQLLAIVSHFPMDKILDLAKKADKPKTAKFMEAVILVKQVHNAIAVGGAVGSGDEEG